MIRKNAFHNCKNPFQGSEKRILTVCSAGLLRSPTLAWLLGQYNYNTRSCGVHDYALIQLDDVLIHWADIIIFVHPDIADEFDINHNNILIFNVPDQYDYKQPELLKILKQECITHGLINEE